MSDIDMEIKPPQPLPSPSWRQRLSMPSSSSHHQSSTGTLAASLEYRQQPSQSENESTSVAPSPFLNPSTWLWNRDNNNLDFNSSRQPQQQQRYHYSSTYGGLEQQPQPQSQRHNNAMDDSMLYSSSSFHRSSQHSHRSSPFVTVTLLKLEAVLPDFCDTLALPSHHNVVQACKLLDNSIATALSSSSSSPSSSGNSSPQWNNNSSSRGLSLSPMSVEQTSPPHRLSTTAPTTPQSPASMSGLSTPLFSWLGERRFSYHPSNWSPGQRRGDNNKSSSPSSSSALALETEWEATTTCLHLMAGAEVLYANLRHLEPEDWKQRGLLGLYRRIIVELQRTMRHVCDPVLESDPFIMATPASSSQHEKKAAAESVAVSLAGLVTLCHVRIELLQLQRRVWDHESLQVVLPALETLVQGELPPVGAAEPLKASMHHELQCWKACWEAAWALQHCQFLDSIVSLRRWHTVMTQQTDLPRNHSTRLTRYHETLHKHFMSLLPVYFDRVDAFAGPLYGFDTAKLFANKKPKIDFEAQLVDLLKRQEKIGGPPTVVTLVLDAVRANNRHVERGFRINATEDPPIVSTSEQDAQIVLPAVFIRSSAHLNAGSSSQRTNSALGGSSTGLHRKSGSSQTSLLPTWAASESPSRNSLNRKTETSATTCKWNVLEYAPDSGETKTWPHSEWPFLVQLLMCRHQEAPAPSPADATAPSELLSLPGTPDQLRDDAVAITLNGGNNADDDRPSRDSSLLTEAATTLFGVSSGNAPSSPAASPSTTPRRRQRVKESRSAFHTVSISKCLSLVVIVKGEEESRWHRRRSKLPDEEIRVFLNEMARELRVNDCFSADRIPIIDKNCGTTLEMASHGDWTDEQVRTFLKQLKDSFGLRPMSSLSERLRSQFNARRSNTSPSKKGTAQRHTRRTLVSQTDLPESAAVLFLGPYLAHSLSE